MASIKLTDLNKINSLNDTDLFYVVKDGVSYGIRKSNLKSSLGLVGGDVSRIISGGMIWVSGLTYETSNLIYEIGGVQFNIADGIQVTLDAAPTTATFQRIDLIYGDNNGNILISKGVESDNPTANALTETQLQLTLVLLDTNATEPSDVAREVVYKENEGEPNEYNTTENTGGLRIDLDSTSSPILGAKSIESIGFVNDGDQIQFTTTTPVLVSDFSYFEFQIKLNSPALETDNIEVLLLNSTTGTAIKYSVADVLDKNDTVNPSVIRIFKSDFWFYGTETQFDSIIIRFTGSATTSLNFKIDECYLGRDVNAGNPVDFSQYMLKSVYDPNLNETDVFELDNINPPSISTASFSDSDFIAIYNPIISQWRYVLGVDFKNEVSRPQDRILTNAAVTGTFNLDYDLYEVWDLTLTGATAFAELNTHVKTLVIRVTGDEALTLAPSWDLNKNGEYEGTLNNLIVVQNYGVGKYWVQISQPN